jgi:mRNA interferase RelE/StbE
MDHRGVRYHIEIETSAVKAFARLPRSDARKVAEKIQALADDPRPSGAVKLTGAEGWRIRVGHYRVVYVIEDAVRIVTVTRIGHRREIYRRL